MANIGRPSQAKVWIYVTASLFMLLIVACRSSDNTNSAHSNYINQVFAIADTLVYGDTREKSLILIDSVFNSTSGITSKDLYRKYRFKVAYYLYADRATALKYADSLLLLCEEDPTPADITKQDCAEAYFSKGEILLAENRYVEAYQFFFRGKLSLDKVKDSCMMYEYRSRFNSQLGNVSYRQKKYKDATLFYKKALTDWQACEKTTNAYHEQMGMEDNIGLSYFMCNMPDSAIRYYDMALEIADLQEKRDTSAVNIIRTQKSRGVILGNRADIYLLQKDTVQAIALLRKSIAINSKPGYEQVDAQVDNIKLAKLFLAQKKFKEVEKQLVEIKLFLDTVNNGEVKMRLLKLQADYYDKKGMLPEAQHYLKQYLVFKDSVDLNRKKAEDVHANITYQNIEQQYELDFFRKQNQQKNVYLIAVFVFLMMAIAIIILALQNAGRSKKSMVQLKKLNEQTSKQNMILQTTLRALEQSQDDNGRMMKVVAHDLRSPIAAMLSISHMLLSERNTFSTDVRRLLEMLKTSGDNSLQLIQDLLQSKQVNIAMHPVDMEALLQDCVGLLHFRADDKKQIIRLETTPVILNASRGNIWRLMTNLIGNSIKFSPENATITVRMIRGNKNVLLSVEDQGIGIPESLQENIFDAFTNARRAGTAGEESYGLGLSIAKQIVLAHKGKIWVESKPGKGTTFFIELPM